MAEALRRGYATTSTDTGHTGANGSSAFGHPEKFIDFAYRSEHEMTVTAKTIVNAFYGRAPAYSYWNGCSTGGRQGLTEVQRYPNDFDGVIAGAQANPRTRLKNAWQLSVGQAALKDPAAYIPTSKCPAIHAAVVSSCDALDGVKDGLISQPMRCRFDPQILACNGDDRPDCLTARQIETARVVMRPAKTARGEEIFPGYAPGTEMAWGTLIGGPEPTSTAIDQYKFIFKDPNWDWRTFNLDRDVAIADKVDNGTINAIDPNIRPFTKHGGKLIMYHGSADGSVAPGTSVNYYNSVVKALGGASKTMESVRLVMVPGMGHCRGGAEPNTWLSRSSSGLSSARLPIGSSPRTQPTALLIGPVRFVRTHRWRSTREQEARMKPPTFSAKLP
jgi:feruloyl esterase